MSSTAFPQETVDEMYRFVNAFRKSSPHQSAKEIFVDSFSDYYGNKESYGFLRNLATGVYAHWRHEMVPLVITHDNCTTVIPALYIAAEAFGFKPKIVQFHNFRNVFSKKGRDETKNPRSLNHFALIVDMGEKHPYLVDPFWNTCHPLLEQTETYMVLGKEGRCNRHTREYTDLVEYSAEEFAAMMQRIREDKAASLDMLVAGQKVRRGIELAKVTCTLMVYYQDKSPTLTTRLYIPQAGITDKYIFYHQQFDNEGQKQEGTLEFCVAKDDTWDKLIEPITIARTNYRELQRFRILVNRVAHRKKRQRLGPGLQREEHQQTAQDLLSLVDTMYARLSDDEKQQLAPRIAARALYETEKPEQEFVFPAEARDQYIRDFVTESWKFGDLEHNLWEQQFLHTHQFEILTPKKIRKIKRQIASYRKKREKAQNIATNFLGLRKYQPALCSRRIDQLLFLKPYEKATPEALAVLLHEKGIDPLIGYAATVDTFVEYAFAGRKEMDLRLFIDDISDRVKERILRNASR